MRWAVACGGTVVYYVSSPDEASVNGGSLPNGDSTDATLDIRSNVSERVRWGASSAVGLVYESTYGWFDLAIIN
jgi:hypothetical protein